MHFPPSDLASRVLVNGAGNFECGGPMGDNGLSGKKLVVDAYGPRVPIGGGALSGKDFFKVDRAGAIAARRLALAIVLGGDVAPAAVLLDEPTRGMDRAAKGALISRLRGLSVSGVAVLVATHDAEFAAALADRVVLLADGRPIVDAPAAEVLAGGWHFATETARVLAEDAPGAGILTPEQGGDFLRGRMTIEVQA